MNEKLTQKCEEADCCKQSGSIECMFYDQVDVNPQKLAILYGDQSINYLDLDRRSNQMADFFLCKSLTRRIHVGCLLDNRIELITVILGALKSGAVFVPFDPNYPEKRLETLLLSVEFDLLVTDEAHFALLNRVFAELDDEVRPEIVLISQVLDQDNDIKQVERPNVIHLADDPVYIYFTSGSTGTPKGIVGRYESLQHFICWELDALSITRDIRVSQLISPSFDAFLRDILIPLTVGGTLCIPESLDVLLNSQQLVSWINQSRVNLIHCVPSLFKLFFTAELSLDDFRELRYILLSGEKIHPRNLQVWSKGFSERIQLINLYGPSETTMVKTYYWIKPEDVQREVIPIGRPMQGAEILLLNEMNELCTDDQRGEIYIRTRYRTLGYYHNEEATREKFLINPLTNEPTDIIYRTGDLGRWMADGNLEFLGRKDYQVKIRGIRVELGEIENYLLNLPMIKEAVVIDQIDDRGNCYLAGYLVADEQLDLSQLRDQLLENLPDYMVPTYLRQLPKMPLTPNGKIDRASLPNPRMQDHHFSDYQPPVTELEKNLARIWSEVLGVSQVGVNDNFFALGGHSLNGGFLTTKIQQNLGMKLPLKVLFANPTIGQLVKYFASERPEVQRTLAKATGLVEYPASSAQRRLFAQKELTGETTTYNMPYMLIIEGDLDVVRLGNAVKQVSIRHESLRTVFYLKNGQLFQKVNTDHIVMTFQQADEAELIEITENFVRPFDLTTGPLARIELVDVGERYLLMIDLHHSIADGSSQHILLRELFAIYAGEELSALPIQYKDYSVWQAEFYESVEYQQQQKFWLEILGRGELPVLQLPYDYVRPAVLSDHGQLISFELPATLSQRLYELSRECGTTLFMTLFTAYNVLLSRYSGQADLIVGTGIAGRTDSTLENMIGMFVNTLAIRSQPVGKKSFCQYLQELKEVLLESYENQEYQFENLVDQLGLVRDLSRNLLIDTVFVMQTGDLTGQCVEGLRCKPYEFQKNTTKFDLTMNGYESADGIRFELEYNTDLFKSETIEQMARHFVNLLQDVTENYYNLIENIQLLSIEDRERFLSSWNQTHTAYPKDQTLVEIFEKRVLSAPDRIALIFEEEELSYRELNGRVNQLARELRKRGVQPEQIVGLMSDRSVEMVVGIFAILKAGGAYLPIDPTYPKARIEFMLEDCGVDLLLTESELMADFATYTGDWLDITEPGLYVGEESNLLIVNQPEDLAYIIYTSGTTGKPKGNMTMQYNVSRVVLETNYLQIESNDRVLQLSNYAFDGSTFDIYGALLNGATLVLINKDVMLEPRQLAEFIKTKQITLFFLTTALFNTLVDLNLDCFAQVRKVLFGGERVSLPHVKKALQSLGSNRLIHVYGPTECTVFATYYPVNYISPDAYTIPIGRPLANTQIYILSQSDQLQPVGVVGELCIAGDGLARGYVNRPEITSEKFVENPYLSGERMYRTGDLARWLADGTIEFVGRLDQQVKVRGFRIELGEIENQLLAHPRVREAVVVAKSDTDGTQSLCAYVVIAGELSIPELRTTLNKELPDHMIPTYFITLPEMPLTVNGKIDYQALPEIQELQSGVTYVAPETVAEKKLTQIWSDVLKVEHIGIDDNFFTLGGHSLKGTFITSRIYKEFGVEIPLRQIFAYPTIRELAELVLQASRTGIYETIEKVAESTYYPVSSAQKRLIALNQLDKESLAYNVPFVWKIEGMVELELLNQAVIELIDRHEALRTSFVEVEGEAMQKIESQVEFSIDLIRCDGYETEQMIKDYIRPFDLRCAPLMRVGFMNNGEIKLFVLDMHHIISDGVTIDILIRELVELYAGRTLRPQLIQYKDFAVWQNKLLTSPILKEQEEFWLELFAGELPVLNLLTDYPRPLVKSYNGAVVNLEIERALSANLYDLALQENATLYMVMMAAFHLLLARYSDQNDIVLGTPMAGRPVAELENVVGMFVNTLAVRNQHLSEESFREFLARVKETVLKVYENQDYQFEMLVEKLNLKRDLSRNPLFDVMLAFENVNEGFTVQLSDGRFEPYQFDIGIAKFDLLLFVFEKDQQIHLELQYSTDLFTEVTVRRMMNHLINLLESITSNPLGRIADLNMLAKEERDQLLFDFNNTSVEYPEMQLIHERFEAQVVKTPEKIAVEYEGQTLSYRQLNTSANRLARLLQRRGVGRESVVGVLLERSLEMVVGLMAILKAGGAYLPIDPIYPKDRILHMLRDAKAELLLTQGNHIEDVDFTELQNLENGQAIIRLSESRGHIVRFNELPMPDRSYIDLAKYKNKIGMASVTNAISLQTTRGCPYLCIYCHKVWSKSHVFRTAENIYQEIEYYYQQGVRNFAIIDDCFNLDRENSGRLFRLIIANQLKVQIFFPNGLRGDLLTPEYIDLMVEAGTVNINLSLETASPRLQKVVKKYLNLDKFRSVMEYIATKHPHVILELATMHGFPTETEEEALQTLQFIKDIRWIHFPYIHILKVFPNTEIEELALANGVSKEDIIRSVNRAYHELPETLPFPKSFTRQYQADFLNNYFLDKERLKHVIPVQMQIMDNKALIQKYNAYLPIEVQSIQDVLDFAGIDDLFLPDAQGTTQIPEIFETSQERAEVKTGAKKVLLLDLSQYFSSRGMLYKVAEQPIGLLYLMTALKERFGERIAGRVYKSGIDFDSYKELKAIIDEYKPDLIGIRTLSFFKEFFHEAVAVLRQWGVKVPIITGGPYATSEYQTLLQDANVDIAVLGEGEETFAELLEAVFAQGFVVPKPDVLAQIKGIAFRDPVELSTTCQVILMEELGDSLEQEDDSDLRFGTTPDQLAYVMYTSGTTGKPKGIMVEHRQVNNCLNWMQDEFPLDEAAIVVQRTNLTFDPSVWELFWPLYHGAKVRLLTTDQGKDASYLIQLLENQSDLTVMYCPASLVTGMTYLLNARSDNVQLRLPWFLIGAEPISMETVKDFYQYFKGQMVNTYGPTECTINNTYYYLHRYDSRQIVPIGMPVANNQLYILSKDLQLQPVKVPGEIYIAGESLARGYIHNPERTAESFIANPFGQGQLYKTGDVGCWLEDGNIQIMGRVDDQVKIRGYRIELGEIETALMRYPKVRDQVVVVRDSKRGSEEIMTCKLCGNTTAYPDVRINSEGVCNLCDGMTEYRQVFLDYFKTLDDLDQVLTAEGEKRKGRYDCLLLYAGGRAAGYALYQLVERGYRVLTATYDNGYFSKKDLEHIKQITASLGVDHIVLTHPKTTEILCASLANASTVCKGCFLTSSSLAVDYAATHEIPVVIGATLSRGQIIENKLIGLLKQGIAEITHLEAELKHLQRMTYVMTEEISQHIGIASVVDGTVYDQVKVVDFYRYVDITNEEMIEYLNQRDEYWQSRRDYAIYSTNCAIKQIGDLCHLQENGFHYYGSATSWEKRLGHIKLENIAEDLQIQLTDKAVTKLALRVGYHQEKRAEELETRYLCAYVVADEEVAVTELREFLNEHLPGYMVPSYIMQLAELPLTSNGKIDKRALPEPEGGVSAAEYVAPTSLVEGQLAVIWGEVLGVKQVGMNDNFFELGGDSIKAIQILAKANQAGLNITVKDIFAHKTIFRLVENVDCQKAKEIAAQDEVIGEIPLTPIQHWFFSQGLSYPHYWNQREMFTLRDDVDLELLVEAFRRIISHHDALRMCYQLTDGVIYQMNRGIDEVEFELGYIDLSHLSEELQVEGLIRESEDLQRKLNLGRDLLIRGIVFDLGNRGKRLLIVIHHLVVDTVSWRILLDDLEFLYNVNCQESLPLKTTSFKEWSNKLQDYVEEGLVNDVYWRGIAETNVSGLVNLPITDNYWTDHRKVQLVLTEVETTDLLTKAHQAYNTEVNDLLLTALTLSIAEIFDTRSFLVNLEGHGREEIIPGIDLSRTIGWFTTGFPVHLEERDQLSETIKCVKESLHQIPDKGIHFGLARYLGNVAELQRLNPEISFNYQGELTGAFDNQGSSTQLLSGCRDYAGRSLDAGNQHPFILDINGMVLQGKLEITLSYNARYLEPETIEELASRYQENLRDVIRHCVNQTETSYTVSDFDADQLDQEDFDLISQLYN